MKIHFLTSAHNCLGQWLLAELREPGPKVTVAPNEEMGHYGKKDKWRLGRARRLGYALWRLTQIPVSFPAFTLPLRTGEISSLEDRYRITRFRTLARQAVRLLPPAWRERVAERFLRRAGAPGPAAEHVVQYLLSVTAPQRRADARAEAIVAKGADNFYERQYRQFFNPVMGAFAMTATQALITSGGAPLGHLWWRRRKTCAAMLEGTDGAPPILVIDKETVALPLLLPPPDDREEREVIEHRRNGKGRMPVTYSKLVAGEVVPCAVPEAVARERAADGALLEVIDCIIRTKKLALLALHPHDPDAMGLHITLFAVDVVEPERVEKGYGLAPGALDPWRRAASQKGRMLLFCIGATEEVFTQCSQNLFIKRATPDIGLEANAAPQAVWNPAMPIENLLARQFETFQATVSASGVPGASPRNGDIGKAAFLGRRGRKSYLLIPYHPGNAVHGHAAKLWSNSYGTIVIFDDHSALSSVTISGPSWVVDHDKVRQDFPSIAGEAMSGKRRNGMAIRDPEYWYLQEVADIVQQREPLSANLLDPGRPACSINAGGEARHGKKPAYFAADTLPPYDPSLQHEREKAGRLPDPSGDSHSRWNESVRSALDSRREHLQQVLQPPSMPVLTTLAAETRESVQ